ncbi:glycosyltransferase family 4 protein [Micromonospora sp. NBC_00898]|uniref:glycosyltransferase family 4 protein n=1 Tax=Micromonospora sp. NBC_00898 TaxID=2975981 RepID=UPI0038635BD9|nr:glycosyltransferase family 4 protein [Micromonospora sp. NBC_00898]
MRIGFACFWDPAPAQTWSRTPWQLRSAMRRHASVVDVGVEMPTMTRMFLRGLHPRWHDGRLRSSWDESRITDAYCRRVITRNVQRLECDAVLEIQDIAAIDRPYFLYQDMSWDALIKMLEAGQPIFRKISMSELRRRQERQREIYENATGVLTMSHWLARSLVQLSGLAASKVHVVHPGLHVEQGVAWAAALRERPAPRRRLLFVGRNFRAKGGDLVLDALSILRREMDPNITVTIAGLPRWPLSGAIPDGVNFLGQLPLAEVASLYDCHDLLVMPTRVEGFGFVFLEALSRGLPCIGRDDFAMPEMIRPGLNGALLSKDDPEELARLIAGVLADDDLYAACRSRIPDVVSWFSWEHAARQTVGAISTALGR